VELALEGAMQNWEAHVLGSAIAATVQIDFISSPNDPAAVPAANDTLTLIFSNNTRQKGGVLAIEDSGCLIIETAGNEWRVRPAISTDNAIRSKSSLAVLVYFVVGVT